ncbi:hypothetical protein K7X08_017180 [Anisodus acutangulus]|uniref:Uncharacterized protein n=1 Tax=Anisodus acutangulus TaxID=402998 RepID=A0A9Q1R4R7_9SOLA|nr:hypothetical protein K7X08_017180 [Anisodus acutangulus]
MSQWWGRTASPLLVTGGLEFSCKPSPLIFKEFTDSTIRCLLALPGWLQIPKLYQQLVFRHKLYQLREERDMKPETFASLVSAIQYEKRELAKDFVIAAEELFETIFQALISSVDRDCLSGWGGHVYVVTPTEVTEKILKGRMD